MPLDFATSPAFDRSPGGDARRPDAGAGADRRDRRAVRAFRSSAPFARSVSFSFALATADAAIWAPLSEGFAALDGPRKWIVDELGGARLYDLVADPGETRDLARDAPTDARARLDVALQRHPAAQATLRRTAPWLAR